jgi:hypothetical protein
MSANVARQDALRNYLVFRIKAMEFLDILALYNCLRANSMRLEELAVARENAPAGLAPLLSFFEFRPPRYAADSLKTVAISWFGLFIDKSAMDAIEV